MHESGPLLVIAGAGFGKTRVLTHRIAHLIHQGVHPSKILAITFTNKAAAEMRERVGALVGPVVKTMWVSTFHSACVRILRANGDLLGYPRQFSIYDSADSHRLTGYVIRDLGLDAKRFPPRGVHAIISRWKNELVDPDEAHRRARTSSTASMPTCTPSTRPPHEGRRDGLRRPAHRHRQTLPGNYHDVLEHYRQRFEHILVDEYQDTNQAQNEMVLLLADGHRNVCVVGDTDQCLPPGTVVAGPEGTSGSRTSGSATRCGEPEGADSRRPVRWPTFTKVASTDISSRSRPATVELLRHPTISSPSGSFRSRISSSCTSCIAPIGVSAWVARSVPGRHAPGRSSTD